MKIKPKDVNGNTESFLMDSVLDIIKKKGKKKDANKKGKNK